MLTLLAGLTTDPKTGLFQWMTNGFNVWPFLILVVGIALLLFLILKAKINTFVALIITSILVALGLGMNPAGIADALKNGIGGTMGELVIVFGFGSMIRHRLPKQPTLTTLGCFVIARLTIRFRQPSYRQP